MFCLKNKKEVIFMLINFFYRILQNQKFFVNILICNQLLININDHSCMRPISMNYA